MAKLNQILAVEKTVKSKAQAGLTELYHTAQKPAMFEGLSRVYSPKDDGGERYPSESQKIQATAEQMLQKAASVMTELFDVTAAKDFANCGAKADVTIDGVDLLKDIPVTFLLFLEKQATDLATFISKIPTLDTTQDWLYDNAVGFHKTGTVESFRTKKVQRPIVKYDAVIKDGQALPAQTEMITEDIVVGTWTQVRQSGAIPADRKEKLQDRVEKLRKAIKMAREEANSIKAEERKIGEKIFSFLLAK